MRSIGWRLRILAMSILSLNRAQVRAQEVLYLEAADWIPTASVLTMPTSYVATGAYVFPTSYAAPTVYTTAYLTKSALVTPTIYLAPSYYETHFRRRGLFGRKLVETSRAYYSPTNAYYPTTYSYPITFRSSAIVDAAVMPTVYARTSSNRCCGETVDTPIVRDLPASSEPAWSTVAISPAARTDHREQPPVRSEQAEDDSIPSNIPKLPTQQLPRREQSAVRSTPSAPTAAKPAAKGQGDYLDTVTDPAAVRSTPSAPIAAKPAAEGRGDDLDSVTDPAAELKSTTRPGPPVSAAPAPDAEVPRPVAPTESVELQPTPDQKAPRTSGQRRDSQRSALTMPRYIRPEIRNVLFGRVEAGDTSEPEEGVRVSISNRQNTSERREALTDAFGRFAMRVPDGDWTVSVTMPSGRVYSVRQINVSNGQITDEIGRHVPGLVITR
jgi:Carboxypeptidase regulatory-like domain